MKNPDWLHFFSFWLLIISDVLKSGAQPPKLVDVKPRTYLQRRCQALGCRLSRQIDRDQGYCYHCIKFHGSCTVASDIAEDKDDEKELIDVFTEPGRRFHFAMTPNGIDFTYRRSARMRPLSEDASMCKRYTHHGVESVVLDYTLAYIHRVTKQHYQRRGGQTISLKLLQTAFAPKELQWNTNDYCDAQYYKSMPDLRNEFQYGYIHWSHIIPVSRFLGSKSDGMRAVIPPNSETSSLFRVIAPPHLASTDHWTDTVAQSTCIHITCAYERRRPTGPDTLVVGEDISEILTEIRQALIEIYENKVTLKARWDALRKKVATTVTERLSRRILTDEGLAHQEAGDEVKGMTQKCFTKAKDWLNQFNPPTPAPPAKDDAKAKGDAIDKLLFGATPSKEKDEPKLEPLPKFGKLPAGA